MTKAELLKLTHWTRHYLLALLEDVPQDRWCFEPFPGANHTLWVVGHLALSDLLGVALFQGGQRDTQSEFYRLFGEGSTPVPDPAAYRRVTM